MVKKNEVKKYQKRIGHTSGRMIEALPKPNVVRIQVLDGPARRSYMGGFQSILDEFRTTMQDACAAASNYNIYEPFYGILDVSNAAGPSINVTANWSEPSNKTGFSMMNTLLTGDGSGGVVGLVPCVGGKFASSTNTALQAVDKLATSSMAFAGMNNNSTGSTTIKHFTSTKIGANMPLKFKWYLPEQEQMCRISIKRLIMMTYVRPMDMDSATIINAAINGIMNAGGKALDAAKDAMKEIGNFAMDAAADSWGIATDSGTTASNREFLSNEARETANYYSDNTAMALGLNEGGGNTEKTSESDKSESSSSGTRWQRSKDLMKKVAGGAVSAYNSINTFFGGEITANPLPVRITVGHYLDLEPVILTSVKITASKEQFISKDGTHLPLWVSADVNFDYWMQPGPTKDFMSFLGSEVFDEWIPRGDPKTDKNQDAGGINGKKK